MKNSVSLIIGYEKTFDSISHKRLEVFNSGNPNLDHELACYISASFINNNNISD